MHSFFKYNLILLIIEQIEEPVILIENHNNTLQQFYGNIDIYHFYMKNNC